jgi:DNA-binding IclR family transcriptional regulator
MRLPLRLARQPLVPTDLDRGYFSRPWFKKTQYGCLYCQLETTSIPDMEKHLRDHEEKLHARAAAALEEKFRPIAAPLFDASGHPITHIEASPDDSQPD